MVTLYTRLLIDLSNIFVGSIMFIHIDLIEYTLLDFYKGSLVRPPLIPGNTAVLK